MRHSVTSLQVAVAVVVGLAASAVAGPLENGRAAAERGDFTTALQLWRPLAEQGDAHAQFNFGIMYENGWGVVQDDAEAFRWYRLAAEQGGASAQTKLGWAYYYGRGVVQDDAAAFRWYWLAAEQGGANAQYNLGKMYENGDGAASDDAEAVKWLRRAAVQGHALAQCNLGLMYATGRGVPQEYVLAHMWFSLASAQGHAGAQNILANIVKFMTPDQIAEAERMAREWKPKMLDRGPRDAKINGERYRAQPEPAPTGKGLIITPDIGSMAHPLLGAPQTPIRTVTVKLGRSNQVARRRSHEHNTLSRRLDIQ